MPEYSLIPKSYSCSLAFCSTIKFNSYLPFEFLIFIILVCFLYMLSVLGATRYISNALRNNITLMSNEYYSEIHILNQ